MADLSQFLSPDDTLYTFKDNSAIVSISRSGNTYTATRHDGTTFEFTQKDDDTTYTFENGTNSFTVTPSGGTAQTVTVTPSIANATQSADGLMSATDKTKLDGVATGAEVNQNAFSNIKVGSTTLAADSKTDTLEFVAGDNITLTPTEVSDKITISSSYTNTTYTLTQDATDGHKFSLEGTDGYFKEITIPDANTTYTIEADTTNNKIKLIPSSGSAVSITVPFATNATNATNATKATGDESGNNIKNTYAASFSISDHTITLKNKNGTSLGTVTVPDNNTTYSFATGDSNGQIKVTPSEGSAQNISVKGLGTAAFKNTTDTYSSSGTDPVTGKAVASALETLPTPMVFKGTLGTGGTISQLPTASASTVGNTYRVITNGTYAGQVAKDGDEFIGAELSSGVYSWVYIPSADEPSGTVTSVGITNGGGLSVSGSPITTSGTITISHADTSSQASVDNSGRTYIQDISLDTYGHVTKITSATETVVNTDRYVNSASFAYDSTNDNVKMTLTRAGSDTATVPANIPKVSSSSAGVVPKGAAVSSQSQSTKFLREDGTWAAPSYTTNTNTTYTIGTSGNTVTLTPSSGSVQSITVPFATNATNATKATQDANGDVIATTYRKLSNNDFDTINVTELNAGDLIVTGVGRFTNGLYGDLSGTATKVSNSLKIQLNGGTTEGTNQFTYDGSAAKTVNVTKSAIGLGNVDNTADANKSVASANTAGSATKATQDESGNNIKATYAASFSISDHTITLKNKNGVSLGTVTVPDNATDNTKLPLAGGTMTGQLVLASTGFKTSNTGGYTTDQYGNFKHQSSDASQYWNIQNNAGTNKFSVYWETGNVTAVGNVTAPKFIGALQGNADTATSATSATNASNLINNTRMEYGWNGVNYFNISGTAGTGVKVNDTPTTAWWHIMRFNHANNSGYYTDLAIPFNHNSIYYKRINAGTLINDGWVKVLDEKNYTDYTVKKDGTGATGTWSLNTYEANLQWGGKNFSAGYGCLDAALMDELGANRFQFIKADAITVEYTRDGGTTWTDYGATDAQKQQIFAQGGGLIIGKADSSHKATENPGKYQLRITIDTGVAGIYTVLNKFIILVSSSGSANCACKIQKALQSTPTTFVDHTDWIPIGGWSGYNVLNVNQLTTYGNTSSSQYGRVRFIFKDGEGGNTSYVGLSVAQIKGFGGVGWICPSTMAKTGHLYTYDQDQNAVFPNLLQAPYLRGTTKMTISNGKISQLATGAAMLFADGIGISNPTTSNDVGWIRVLGTGESDTVMEIATGDDGGAGEQIVVRQYNTSSTVVNEATLLDKSGNTTFPKNVTATKFIGALQGNADTATTATTASKLGSSNVGSAIQPIYLSGGTPTACTYTLGKSVPSDAVFTDQYVSQSATTTSDYRKIVLSYQNGSAGAAVTDQTNVVYVTANAEVQPSTGNIRSAGTVSAANLSATTNVTGTALGVTANNGTSGGISLYNGVNYITSYGIAMRKTTDGGTHGYVQGDWGTYFYMAGATNRGWVFVNAGSGNRASISTEGNMVLNGSLTLGGNTTNTSGVRQVYNSTTKSLDFVFVA